MSERFTITLLTIGLTGCSLSPQTSSLISLRLGTRPSALGASLTTGINFDQPPSLLSDLDCIGVNVTGPEIESDSRVNCTNPDQSLGIVAGLVDAQTPILELNVPRGRDRRIDLFGVRSATGCTTLHSLLNDPTSIATSEMGAPYLIGRTTVDTLTDSVVPLTLTLDPAHLKKPFSSCGARRDLSLSQTVYHFALDQAAAQIDLGPKIQSADPGDTLSLSDPTVTSGLGTLLLVGGPSTTISFAPAAGFTGTAVAHVTIHNDTKGTSKPAILLLKVRSHFAWTNASGDHNATHAANWCGPVDVNTGCTNAGSAPLGTDLLEFDDSCEQSNCDVIFPTSGTIIAAGIKMKANFTGAVTPPTNFTINGPFEQAGGTFDASAGGGPIIQGQFILVGGTFKAPSGNTLVLSAGVDISTSTFEAGSGSVRIAGSGATIRAPLVLFSNVVVQPTGTTSPTHLLSNLTVTGSLTINPDHNGFSSFDVMNSAVISTGSFTYFETVNLHSGTLHSSLGITGAPGNHLTMNTAGSLLAPSFNNPSGSDIQLGGGDMIFVDSQTITNGGTIEVQGGRIRCLGDGLITNSGTITSGNGGEILAGQSGTITNTGTITMSTAGLLSAGSSGSITNNSSGIINLSGTTPVPAPITNNGGIVNN